MKKPMTLEEHVEAIKALSPGEAAASLSDHADRDSMIGYDAVKSRMEA